MSNEELELARDMGAATYLAAVVNLFANELNVTIDSNDSVSGMAALMVEPLNLATQTCLCWMMDDQKSAEEAFRKLRMAIELLPRE